jgi:hypothetical protein
MRLFLASAAPGQDARAGYILYFSDLRDGGRCRAAFRNSSVRRLGAWFILAGAVFFYASDIFVAHQRFVMEQFYNRLFGLPLYYTAQFLLAFSVGLVKGTENRDVQKSQLYP